VFFSFTFLMSSIFTDICGRRRSWRRCSSSSPPYGC
jgi:hypothetical protein